MISGGAAKHTPERSEEGNGAGEPSTVPQWAIDLALRPAVRTASRLLWRLRFLGVEHVPQEGGLVLAANHQTYLDPFWACIPVMRPVRFLAWSEAFKWPVVGKTIEWLGAWPLDIERVNPTAYRRSLRWLRAGGAVMIFPEGARSTASGEPMRFKSGAARLALEAGARVLPVTIRGGNRAWPRGQTLPRPARVEIFYHPPRLPAPLPGEDARRCARRETEALADVIKSAL